MAGIREITIFSIDPGYGRCGIAVITRKDSKDFLIASDCIETSKEDLFTERLAAVVAGCKHIINEHRPHVIALEKLFFAKNTKTAMQVAEVRGALIGLAGLNDIPVVEYTPGQVKNAVTGYGSADKKTVTRMIHLLLPISKKIEHDDEYDAIAVGLTHLAHARSM